MFSVEKKFDEQEIISVAKMFDLNFTTTDRKIGVTTVLYSLNYGSDGYGACKTIISEADTYKDCKTFDEYIEKISNKGKYINELKKQPDYKILLNKLLEELKPLNQIVKNANDELVACSNGEAMFKIMRDNSLSNEEKTNQIKKLQKQEHENNQKVFKKYKYYETHKKIYEIIKKNFLLYDSLNFNETEHQEMLKNINFADKREEFEKINRFINELLLKHASIYIISHFGHELKIPVKKEKIVRFQDLSIEHFAFLPYNTLLKITK
jgi:hypothetical protein